jgi:hypothetical protein
LLLLALALAPVAARAQNPQYMSYQGYLTDGTGNPLGSTNTGPKAYDVVFRIWDLPTGGTIGTPDELFAELQTVTVDNGYFSVLLGQGTSYQTEPHGQLSGVFTSLNTPRYVEMTVLGIGVSGGNVTILPRLQLVYAPFAFSAVNVSGNNVITAANLSTNLGLWQANGPNIYYNSGNGNVGIGTPSPTARLQAQGHNIVNLFAGDESPFGVTGLETWFSTPQTHIYCSEGPGNTNVFNVGAGGTAFLAGKLTFADVFGDRISLWDGYEFGIGSGDVNPGGRLLIHTDNANSDIVFGSGPSSTNMRETMRITGNGSVGINTSGHYPEAGLDVNGTTLFRNLVDVMSNNVVQFGIGLPGQEQNAGVIGYEVFTGDSLDIVGAGTTNTNRKIQFWAEGGANFDGPVGINGNASFNQFVGIGTTSPLVPLDVFGYGLIHSNSYGYLNASGATGGYNNPAGDFWPYSIRASERIMALEFNAASDRRIKDIMGQSDGPEDLQIIQKLRVTDYRMKDRVANGDTPCKGFIAQEVETVIPEAVTKSRQFVPDIYAAASGAKFDPAAKTVAVKLAKAHGLKTGDRVRLMTEAGKMDLPISSVPSEQEFVAANCQKDPKQVFVFGKEVSDFRTLNYDRIFTTGISAMQELARRVTTLEAHEAERLALEQRAARVDALEREVSELKNMVTQLAQSAKDGHSRPQTVSWTGTKEQTRDELTPVTLEQ